MYVSTLVQDGFQILLLLNFLLLVGIVDMLVIPQDVIFAVLFGFDILHHFR